MERTPLPSTRRKQDIVSRQSGKGERRGGGGERKEGSCRGNTVRDRGRGGGRTGCWKDLMESSFFLRATYPLSSQALSRQGTHKRRKNTKIQLDLGSQEKMVKMEQVSALFDRDE